MGDAIQLFNGSWNALLPKTIIKCWNKSDCLAEEQVVDLNSTLIGASSTDDVDIDLTSTMYLDQVSTELSIGRRVAAAIQNSLSELNSVGDTPQTALIEILNEVSPITAVTDFLAVLNSESPDDLDPTQAPLSNCSKNLEEDQILDHRPMTMLGLRLIIMLIVQIGISIARCWRSTECHKRC